MYISWETYFMSLAYLVAMKSKDKSTHFGAVITDKEHNLLATGCNSFVRGYFDTDKTNFERPRKYTITEHAERNGIYCAGRVGIKLLGATLYTQAIPCPACARAVRQVGIDRVVVHTPFHDKFYSNKDTVWNDNLKESLRILNPEPHKFMISLEWFDGPIITEIKSMMFGEEFKL